jgi:glucose-6-phosphate isomerase
VAQGITVYGNKGSTDQHAYVQQLRDGVRQLLRDSSSRCCATARATSMEVDPGVTAGDYLFGISRGHAPGAVGEGAAER